MRSGPGQVYQLATRLVASSGVTADVVRQLVDASVDEGVLRGAVQWADASARMRPGDRQVRQARTALREALGSVSAAVRPGPVVDLRDTVPSAVAPARSPADRERSPEGVVAFAALVLALGVGGGLVFASTPASATAVTGVLLLLVATTLVRVAARNLPRTLVVLFAIRASLDYVGSGGGAVVTPAAAVGILFLASAGLWMRQRWQSGGEVTISRSSAALFFLTAAAFLSSLTATAPVDSIDAAVRILSSAVMLLVLEQILRERPRTIRPLLVALFLSLVLPALVGVSQLLGSAPAEVQYGHSIDVGRIRGTFVHPNPFATYLLVPISLVLALLPHVRGRVRLGLGLAGATAVTLLFFTYARAAWAALVVAVVVIGWFWDRRIIGAAMGGIVIVALTVPSVGARFSDLHSGDEINDTPNSLEWRLEYWEDNLPLTAEAPVTGVGLETVQQTNDARLPPHSVFVQTVIEMGALGLAALIALILAMAGDLRRALRRFTGGIERALTVGAIATAVAFLLQSASENLLTQALLHWYLLLPVAWATAASPWRTLRRTPDGRRRSAGAC